MRQQTALDLISNSAHFPTGCVRRVTASTKQPDLFFALSRRSHPLMRAAAAHMSTSNLLVRVIAFILCEVTFCFDVEGGDALGVPARACILLFTSHKFTVVHEYSRRYFARGPVPYSSNSRKLTFGIAFESAGQPNFSAQSMSTYLSLPVAVVTALAI